MVRYVQEHWIALLLLLVSLVYTAAAPQYGLKMKPVPEAGVVPFILGSIFSVMMILHLYLNWAKVRPEEDALCVKNMGLFAGFLGFYFAADGPGRAEEALFAGSCSNCRRRFRICLRIGCAFAR